MQKVRQDAILGVVFFAALGLLLAATFVLSNFSFRDRPRVEVHFENAGGLEKGDSVYVLGRRAGEVIDVSPREDAKYRISVLLQFDEAVALKSDARIEIIDANLLGGKRIEIEPGRAATPVVTGAPIVGTLKRGAIDALGDELQGEGGLLGSLKKAVDKLNSGEGTLAQLLSSGRLHDALMAGADSLVTSLKAIEEKRGAVGILIHDQETGENVRDILRSARSVANKVDSGEGPLGVAVNDATVARQLRQVIDDVATMTADLRNGVGAIGLLLRDEGTRQRVSGIVDDVAAVLAAARNPSAGLVGALLGDTELLADAKALVANVRLFTERATSGNGLLARLVNDEDWGRRFGLILGQVQRAIEDAREAAPVGTFLQVLTGFF